MKGMRVTVQTCLNSARPFFFVLQVVETVAAVAVGTEFAVGKAFTVTARKQGHSF